MLRRGTFRALPFVLVFLFVLVPAAVAFAKPSASFDGPAWYDGRYYFGTGYYADSHQVADLDNDGDTDIVVPMYDDGAGAGYLRTYLNDGAGSFTESDVTTISGSEAQMADLDRDGNVDVVAVTTWSGHSLTIAKGDGAGGLDVVGYIDPGYVTYYRVADFNGDTIPDILVGTGNFDDARMYLGNGDCTFTLSNVISDIGYNSWSASAADINRDGKQDFVVANLGSDTLDIRLGDGDGIGFTALPDLPTLDRPTRTILADLDRDGILDLACNYLQSPMVSVWHGDGTGGFGARRDYTMTYDVNDLQAADVNLDGTLDLVLGGQQTGGYQSEITVMLGDGNGGFPVRVKPSYGDYWAYGLNAIRVADFDDDGRPDLSATHTNSNGSMNVTLLWNSSTIDHSLDLKLTSLNTTVFSPWRLDVGDLDRDGNPDLVVGSQVTGQVTPYFGDGEGGLSGNTTYGGVGGQMLGLSIADIDNDGAEDVLTVDQDGLGVFDGDGAGGLTLTTRETTSGSMTGDFIDANRDGDLDVVVPAADAASVARVFAGAGDGSLTASGTLLLGPWNDAVCVADFNGDAIQDVATVGDSNLRLAFGDGLGGFTVTTGAMVAPFVTMQMAAGDINGDGKTDLVVATNYLQPILNDGTGPATLGTIVNNAARGVTLADFDLDGTLDAVTCGMDGHIRYLANDGTGTFTQVADVDTGSTMALHTIVSGDFDRDGRPDVAAVGGGKLYLVTNDVAAPYTTLSISPSSYDGENGWYVTTPTVTFTTNESAETSFSLNGGPWTTSDGSGIGPVAPGMNTVTYRSADTAGHLEDQQWFSFAVDNAPPVTTAIGLPGSVSSTAVTFTLEATDTASGIAGTLYSLNGGDPQVYVGEVTLDDDGTTTLRYWSVDNAGNVESPNAVDVELDLPDPPVTSPDAYGTDEDAPLTVDAPGVLVNDSDPEGGSLTATAAALPAHGTLTLSSDGGFLYTPEADWSGTDEFTYAAINIAGTSAPETVTITVDQVNDPPSSAAISDDTIAENEPAGSVVGTLTTTDVDSTDFTYSLPDGMADNAAFTIDGDQLKTAYPFDFETMTSYSVFVCASDQLGAYTYQTLTIQVADAAEPPVTAPDGYTTSEDATLTVLLPGVLGNDTDPLSGFMPTGFRITAVAPGMSAVVDTYPSRGALTFNSDGSFSYVPDADSNGTDLFTYAAINAEGSSAVETVTIDVDAVNDAPTGMSLTDYAIAENKPSGSVVGTLTASDIDSAGFTYAIQPGLDGSAFAIVGSQLRTSEPFDHETKASYTVAVRVTDDEGGTYARDLTIDVDDVNEPPTAFGDSYTTTESVAFTVGAPGILGNDSDDPEGETVSSALVSDVTNGTLALDPDGGFAYTPDADFHGTDRFTYRAEDPEAMGTVATVTITVTALDSQAPTTTSDAKKAYAGEAVITLTAEDDNSGVAATYWKLDGDPEVAGGSVHVVTTGEHRLEFWSVDNADNVEATNVATFTVSSDIIPIEGSDRYGTAIRTSQVAFPEGAPEAVICRGDLWADVAGGSALAGAVDGPLLLTRSNTVGDDLLAELDRLGVRHVYILGDEHAISTDVEDVLVDAIGAESVTRVGGYDRYDTARLVAELTVELLGQQERFDGQVFLATGREFPDAIAAAPLATRLHRPIILTRPESLSAEASEALVAVGAYGVHILGDTHAVSALVESQTAQVEGIEDVERLQGTDRFLTAIAIAEYGVSQGLEWNGVAVGTGTRFPDALSGGVMQGHFNSVVLLTRPNVLYPAVADLLHAHRSEIGFVRILGDTSAVSENVRLQIDDALK